MWNAMQGHGVAKKRSKTRSWAVLCGNFLHNRLGEVVCHRCDPSCVCVCVCGSLDKYHDPLTSPWTLTFPVGLCLIQRTHKHSHRYVCVQSCHSSLSVTRLCKSTLVLVHFCCVCVCVWLVAMSALYVVEWFKAVSGHHLLNKHSCHGSNPRVIYMWIPVTALNCQ